MSELLFDGIIAIMVFCAGYLIGYSHGYYNGRQDQFRF